MQMLDMGNGASIFPFGQDVPGPKGEKRRKTESEFSKSCLALKPISLSLRAFKAGFDWRKLAAEAYQESKMGLMNI